MCLLVHEGAGPGGAIAVGLVVKNGSLSGDGIDGETQEAGGFAAHLEDSRRFRMQERHRGCDGLEVVDAFDRDMDLEEPGTRPGDEDAMGGKVGDDVPDGGKDRLRDAHRIAEGPAIGGEEEGLRGGVKRKTCGPHQPLEVRTILGLPDNRGLDADGPDVDSDANTHEGLPSGRRNRRSRRHPETIPRTVCEFKTVIVSVRPRRTRAPAKRSACRRRKAGLRYRPEFARGGMNAPRILLPRRVSFSATALRICSRGFG